MELGWNWTEMEWSWNEWSLMEQIKEGENRVLIFLSKGFKEQKVGMPCCCNARNSMKYVIRLMECWQKLKELQEENPSVLLTRLTSFWCLLRGQHLKQFYNIQWCICREQWQLVIWNLTLVQACWYRNHANTCTHNLQMTDKGIRSRGRSINQ